MKQVAHLDFFLPGGTLRFLLPVVPVSNFGTMDDHSIFVTTGGSLPDGLRWISTQA